MYRYGNLRCLSLIRRLTDGLGLYVPAKLKPACAIGLLYFIHNEAQLKQKIMIRDILNYAINR